MLATVKVAGRFQVDAQPGTAGGMGVVHRAKDLTTGNQVALKLLSQNDADSRDRFFREAAILAQMDHPGIVKYVAHGEDAGTPFLAMEWVEGATLFTQLTTVGVTLADTVTLGRQVADALAYAHGRGVIHRDIKPSNLLLRTSYDDIAVVDFGIARAGEAPSSLTETGAMLGTPSYMSPEQARGERVVTGAADIFSLGCVLYECATGRLAFEGRHLLALVAKVTLWEPPRVRELAEEAPVELDELIMRMLEKEAAKRPSADEVAKTLATLESPDLNARVRPAISEPARTVAQRLISVIAAAPPDLESTRLATERRNARRQELSKVLKAPFDVMADGAVVSVVSGARPQDVVERAVETAQLIAANAPDFVIAVRSGQANDATALGGAIDSTVGILAKEALAGIFSGVTSSERPANGIRVDDATARMCAPETIVRANGIAYLLKK